MELKQRIIKIYSVQWQKVTGKRILEYLKMEDPEIVQEDISGFDIDFKSALTSYLDFKKQVVGNEIEKDHYKRNYRRNH